MRGRRWRWNVRRRWRRNVWQRNVRQQTLPRRLRQRQRPGRKPMPGRKQRSRRDSRRRRRWRRGRERDSRLRQRWRQRRESNGLRRLVCRRQRAGCSHDCRSSGWQSGRDARGRNSCLRSSRPRHGCWQRSRPQRPLRLRCRRLCPPCWCRIWAAAVAGEAEGAEAGATAARRQGWAAEAAEASAVRTIARETVAASRQRCTCPRLRRRHR